MCNTAIYLFICFRRFCIPASLWRFYSDLLLKGKQQQKVEHNINKSSLYLLFVV